VLAGECDEVIGGEFGGEGGDGLEEFGEVGGLGSEVVQQIARGLRGIHRAGEGGDFWVRLDFFEGTGEFQVFADDDAELVAEGGVRLGCVREGGDEEGERVGGEGAEVQEGFGGGAFFKGVSGFEPGADGLLVGLC
jgi:hypothetical protein